MSRSSAPLVFALAVFIVALGIRAYHLGENGTWQDETKEARVVHDTTLDSGHGSGRMTRNTIRFAQPPMSFYFQELVLANAGFTLAGMRLHSALAGALLCAVFALLWLRWRPPRSKVGAWSIGVLAIPLLDRVLVYYSQEARPYATGCLLAGLCLAALDDHLFQRRGRVEVRALLGLTVLQLVYLLSVGFQPLVVLFTFCLALAPLLCLRALRLRVVTAWATSLVAVLAFLPWQTLPLETYANRVKGGSGSLSGIFASVLDGGVSWPAAERMDAMVLYLLGLNTTGVGMGSVRAFIVVGAALSLVYVVRRRAWRRLALLVVLGLFFFSFAPTYCVLRDLLIAHRPHPRYTLTAAPFMLGFVVALVVTALEGVAALFPRRRAIARAWTVRAVGVALAAGLVVGYGSVLPTAYGHRVDRYDLVFGKLAELSVAGDRVYSPDYRLRWALDLHEVPHVGEARPMASLVGDLARGAVNDDTPHLFLLIYAGKRYDKAGIRRLPGAHGSVTRVFQRKGLQVIRISRGKSGMLQTLRDVFDEWSAWVDRTNAERADYVRETASVLRALQAVSAAAPPDATEGSDGGPPSP